MADDSQLLDKINNKLEGLWTRLGELTIQVGVMAEHVRMQNGRIVDVEALAKIHSLSIAVLQTKEANQKRTIERTSDRVWQVAMPLLAGLFGAILTLVCGLLTGAIVVRP